MAKAPMYVHTDNLSASYSNQEDCILTNNNNNWIPVIIRCSSKSFTPPQSTNIPNNHPIKTSNHSGPLSNLKELTSRTYKDNIQKPTYVQRPRSQL